MKIKNYYSLKKGEKLVSYNIEKKLYLVKTITASILYKLFINENEHKVKIKDIIKFGNFESYNGLQPAIIIDKNYYLYNKDKLVEIKRIIESTKDKIYFINDDIFYSMNKNLNIKKEYDLTNQDYNIQRTFIDDILVSLILPNKCILILYNKNIEIPLSNVKVKNVYINKNYGNNIIEIRERLSSTNVITLKEISIE